MALRKFKVAHLAQGLSHATSSLAASRLQYSPLFPVSPHALLAECQGEDVEWSMAEAMTVLCQVCHLCIGAGYMSVVGVSMFRLLCGTPAVWSLMVQ